MVDVQRRWDVEGVHLPVVEHLVERGVDLRVDVVLEVGDVDVRRAERIAGVLADRRAGRPTLSALDERFRVGAVARRDAGYPEIVVASLAEELVAAQVGRQDARGADDADADHISEMGASRKPPSTNSVWPVTYLDSSLTR